MSNDKFELHPDLKDASLEKACNLAKPIADAAVKGYKVRHDLAENLHYMLEYLRLNFDLVPKK